MGELLGEKELSRGGDRGNQHTGGKVAPDDLASPTLKDLGITKNQSSASQRIVSIPHDVFEGFVAKCAIARNLGSSTSVAAQILQIEVNPRIQTIP